MSIDQNVSHPSHYGGKDDPYETIKVIDAWGLDKSFCLGNVIKYISRAGKKDGNSLLQDLMKAQFYLNYEVEKLHKYDGNYERMKADERKTRLLDEKKELEEYLDDLQSRFADLQADGVIDVDVDEFIDEFSKAVSKYKKETSNKDKEISNADDSNACSFGTAKEYACESDECKKCKYSDSSNDDCGVHTISVPDDVGDAINKVADYFLDFDDDYEIGITDDGALVIAPSDYDWDSMEADDEECD